MELQVTTSVGEGAATSVAVSDAVFGQRFNEALIHQVVTAYLAGARLGTRAQKTRSQVSGGGTKPWRQKGTGRARAGTIRSPLWRGGGQIFAATPQDHSQKVNRKAYRAAMRSILSELVRQARLVIVDQLGADAPKTRDLAAKLRALELDDVLIVTSEVNRNLYLAARNLPRVDVCDVAGIDPLRLVKHDTVLVTADAVSKIEEWLA